MTDQDKKAFIEAMKSEAFKSHKLLRKLIDAPLLQRQKLEQEYIDAGVLIGHKIIQMVQSPEFKADQKFQMAMQAAMEGVEKDLGMSPAEKALSGELSVRVTLILSQRK